MGGWNWNWKCQWPNGKVRLQTKLEKDSNLVFLTGFFSFLLCHYHICFLFIHFL